VKSVSIICAQELLLAIRDRWVLATTLLLAALSLSLVLLGSAPTGQVGVGALEVVIVSLTSLSIFLVPLIALLIAHDAIVGEAERGTLALLLSYPVRRWQVIVGKFSGHLLILVFATVIGYGAAAVALALTGADLFRQSLVAFVTMVGSSVLLGAVFVAVGYLISTLASDRGTAAGAAIGVWLLLVLIYDMALLGVLVIDQGNMMTTGILNILLLLNPTDVYRLFNLTQSANVSQFAGMTGLAQSAVWSQPTLLAVLVLWVIVPLALATTVFTRRQV
jgi:Cu-processing system permease protein